MDEATFYEAGGLFPDESLYIERLLCERDRLQGDKALGPEDRTRALELYDRLMYEAVDRLRLKPQKKADTRAAA
jgi:hypothetical protein